MKKLLFLSLFLLIPMKVQAAPQFYPFEEFRTTSPSAAFTNFVVSTGPTKIWAVYVTSGNPASSFTFKNGTSAATIETTSPVYDTDTTGDSFLINKTLSEGFMFTTTGVSVLQVDWDWVNFTPKGQESRGKY